MQTSAVQIGGALSDASWREMIRRLLPPHSLTQNRRLACQTQVLGDIEVTKFDRFWGQGEQVRWTTEG